MAAEARLEFVRVFSAGPEGGNPAPIVVDATGMSDADMQEVAQSYGHESGFVLPPPPGSDCDFEFRFWVPNHEMSMCGHATVGAVWLLERLGRLKGDRLAIQTKSGRVTARIQRSAGRDFLVEISQPPGVVEPIPGGAEAEAAIVEILGIRSGDLAPFPIQNARTSRVKTLVPLKSVSILDGLKPDFSRMEQLCSRLESTGLYPYAIFDQEKQIVDARQFPKASGYPEDAATGMRETQPWSERRRNVPATALSVLWPDCLGWSRQALAHGSFAFDSNSHAARSCGTRRCPACQAR